MMSIHNLRYVNSEQHIRFEKEFFSSQFRSRPSFHTNQITMQILNSPIIIWRVFVVVGVRLRMWTSLFSIQIQIRNPLETNRFEAYMRRHIS